jgi:hypothetical protein
VPWTVTSSGEGKKLLPFYVLYSKFSEPLPVTLLAAIALAPFVFEYHYFSTPPVCRDPCGHFGLGQGGSFSLNILTVAQKQDIVEGYSIAHLGVQFLNAQHIAGTYLVLLASGFHHCVHDLVLQKNKSVKYLKGLTLSSLSRKKQNALLEYWSTGVME